MQHKMKWIIGGALAGALVLGGVGAVAADQTGTDDDRPLTGEQYDRATRAALDHTKGGKVTETETGDDAAAYGVEVLMDDGRQVEVNLDDQYRVTNSEADDDTDEADDDADDPEADDD
jgi:hypothetical protein